MATEEQVTPDRSAVEVFNMTVPSLCPQERTAVTQTSDAFHLPDIERHEWVGRVHWSEAERALLSLVFLVACVSLHRYLTCHCTENPFRVDPGIHFSWTGPLFPRFPAIQLNRFKHKAGAAHHWP